MRQALELLARVQLRYPGAFVSLRLGDDKNPLRLVIGDQVINIEQGDLDSPIDAVLDEIFALMGARLEKQWDWLEPLC